jgi:hypothetical protein
MAIWEMRYTQKSGLNWANGSGNGLGWFQDPAEENEPGNGNGIFSWMVGKRYSDI